MTAGERRIGPPPWGRAFAALASFVIVAGPLAVAERAFGLHEPLGNQLILLPLGLAGGVFAWRGLRPRLAAPAAVLHVTADRLELLTPGRPVVVVDRSAVGAVIIDGDDVFGGFTIVVHDNQSRVLHRWAVRWPGRRPAAVLGALDELGWPTAIGAELYDGPFQAQVEGRPPMLHRPGSAR